VGASHWAHFEAASRRISEGQVGVINPELDSGPLEAGVDVFVPEPLLLQGFGVLEQDLRKDYLGVGVSLLQVFRPLRLGHGVHVGFVERVAH